MTSIYFRCLLGMYFKTIAFLECCTTLDTDSVENAFISCTKNVSCEVQCYRGYILPTGETKTNYSCDEIQTGMISSCKSIPDVTIAYKTTWTSHNIPPSQCGSFSILLSHSEEMVDKVLKLCNKMAVDCNMTFTYGTLAFEINAIFTGEYHNFTSSAVLENCATFHLDYIQNEILPFIGSLFDNITCENQTINHTLKNSSHISDRQEHCPAGTEVKNIKVTQSSKYNTSYYMYCDSSEPSSTTDYMWDTASQNFTTVENSTFIYFGTSSNLNGYTFKRKTLYYIIASAAGVLILLTLISILVAACKTNSFKTLEEHSQCNEMKELEMSYGTQFKGILIENEFYQSADDAAIVSKDDIPIVRNDTGEYSTALPYSKVELSELESNENNYSYATPVNQVNRTVSNDVIDEEINLQANRDQFSNAKFSENPPIVESSRVVFKEESKEEQNSLEAALSVLDEWIEENKVTRDSCQYTLVDKTFKTA